MNLKIQQGSVVSKITPGIQTELSDKLSKLMAFQPEGYEFSSKFQNGHWDGYIRLFNRRLQSFPAGFTETVVNYLTSQGHTIEWSGDTIHGDFKLGIEAMERSGKKARVYQRKALEVALQNKYKRGIIALPPRMGKTNIMGMIFGAYDKNSLFICESLDIAYQTVDVFDKMLGPPNVGIIGDGRVEIRQFTVATVQSLCSAYNITYESVGITYKEKAIFEKEKVRQFVETAEVVCVDEAQHSAAKQYREILSQMDNAKAIYGLSVGGDSSILIRKNKKEIERLSIEDFYKRFSNKCELVFLKNYEVRAFNGKGFTWKPIEWILKHSIGNKKAFEIITDYGRKLTLTEDHSLYVYKNNKLQLSMGKDLKVNDKLLLEDRYSTETYVKDLFVPHYLYGKKFHFVGNFGSWIDQNIKDPGVRYIRRNGKYGVFISFREFKTDENNLQKSISRIYWEGAHGNWISPYIKIKDFAYLLGFYLGDGWVNGSRVNFAVESKRLNDFLYRLRKLESFCKFKYEIKKTPGNSFEIRINNVGLANIFGSITNFGKAYTKRIPKEVFSFLNSDIREFIMGLMDSDGHLAIRTRRRRRYCYTTVSKALAVDLTQLLKRLGIVAGISSRKPSKGGIVRGRQIHGKKIVYTVNFSEYSFTGMASGRMGTRIKQSKFYNGSFVKIKAIKEVKIPYVYDIHVKSKSWHTFVASDILVHNSATPFRTDGMDILLEAEIGPIIFKRSYQYAIERKYLVPLHVIMYRLPTPIEKTYKSSYQALYKKYITGNELRNRIITEVAKEFVRTGKSVVGAISKIKHGEKLLEMYGKKGILLTGKEKTDRRISVKNCLHKKTQPYVISTLFSEGVDIPSLNSLINCMGGKSAIEVFQRLRPLTPFPGKEKGYLIDFYDDVKYLKNHSKKRFELYCKAFQGVKGCTVEIVHITEDDL